ncbi:MAG: hypothetical protein BYD32DRAFT_405178 [Podila humilis]|nr:MAG: hypothetical protein BYD32DRAFT_405178 [Podila humilis]
MHCFFLLLLYSVLITSHLPILQLYPCTTYRYMPNKIVFRLARSTFTFPYFCCFSLLLGTLTFHPHSILFR